ncbi:hypothetical protein [Aquabacterium sp. OR-4]|uniref:hypothetical protein n=1 Tax=Aquabacterium sp. OR-4 TaxID=2978127 RepID=UPI0021B3040D|nr:hypothetical protein [Aquabacterium sp. OR-4]MDT7838188.1 hypothetical protein [Aquabacterium sp. OR-4]
MPSATHLQFCRFATAIAASWGGTLLLWPAASTWLPTGELPALHARCVGVLHLALASGLWSALRLLDEAAARLPLLLLSTWGAAAVAAALMGPPSGAGRAWLVCLALAAAGAVWLLASDEAVLAPAERLALGWAALGLGAGALGATLLLLPDLAASQWPWRMNPTQASAYGPPLLGFGIAACAAARERRRYARAPAMQAWLALSAGLLLVSLLHLELFAAQRSATWIWFGLLAVIATWAVAHQGGLQRPSRAAAAGRS